MNNKVKQALVPVILGVFTALAFILGAKFGEKRVLTEEGLFQSPRKLFDGEADVIAARKLLRLSLRSPPSVTVPGVTTRTT